MITAASLIRCDLYTTSSSPRFAAICSAGLDSTYCSCSIRDINISYSLEFVVAGDRVEFVFSGILIMVRTISLPTC